MRVRLDPDEAAECAAGAIVERVFVKKIAGRVRRDVVLQGAGVEFLVAIGNGDSEEIAAPAFADETAETFEPRIFSAEMQIETHGRGIVIDRGRVHLQRAHVFAPGLRANVSDFRARAGDEIVHSAGEAGGNCRSNERKCSMTVTFAKLIRDQKQMRKDRNIFAAQPVEDLNRQIRSRRRAARKEMCPRKPTPGARQRTWPSRAPPAAT